MPKYEIALTFSDLITFDTDDYLKELKEAEVDLNDPDAIHDFVRELFENDRTHFDDPSLDEVKVTLKK